MQMNRERYVQQRNEVQKLQRKIIKINLVIREIQQELTYIKIKQQNDNEKFEEAISKQSEDTRFMEKILQQVK